MGVANDSSAKSIAKLSSGYRINSAADDAAGLSISEKMRGQIRGLNQASSNAQDGISMIQTAEGALNETQAILQRMRELAVQSSSATNVDELDRAAIQNELKQLTEEIDRIGDTTEFNTQKLLNGGGVDPSKTASTSQLLDIPANLEGGQTGAVAATSTFTIGDLSTAANKAAIDGKDVTFKLGEKEITLTFNANLSKSNETQIGIKDISNDKTSAAAIRDALTAAIAKDDDLKDQYTVTLDATNTTDTVIVTAENLAFQDDGTLKGVDYAEGNIEFATTDATINAAVTEAATKGVGTRASTTIDFTGKTAEELVGEGIYIDGKKIDFFDSSNGDYKGDADFSVDLKGAGNAEAIVDKVVKALHDGTSDGTPDAGANASKLDDVIVTKGEDNNLVITAKASGIAGNSIKLEDNFAKDISNVKGTDKITGEEVTSANGLKDGTHTVEITHQVASTTIQDGSLKTGSTATLVGTEVTIDSETTMENGTYKLVMTGAQEAKLQKQQADGTFKDIETGVATGSPVSTITNFKIGDLTFNLTDAGSNLAADDEFTFSVEKQHYSATLKEQDGTKGEAVKIDSNDVNVELKAQDGSGSATINVGKIEDSLAIGASTEFTFETATPVESEEAVVGGTFEAQFQIGANEGQNMKINIGDMRSEALGLKDIDLSTREGSEVAMTTVNDAINKVSNQRSTLGAFQNRLDHTIKNLDNSAENLQAAESRIRDVDMAKEMMEQTKQNILSQAATAMLAQANSAPQGVLQLLR